jgi:hypothetical protein
MPLLILGLLAVGGFLALRQASVPSKPSGPNVARIRDQIRTKAREVIRTGQPYAVFFPTRSGDVGWTSPPNLEEARRDFQHLASLGDATYIAIYGRSYGREGSLPRLEDEFVRTATTAN